MPRHIAATAIILLVTLATQGRAQDCNALLTHGLRNIQISRSAAAAKATSYFNHCRKDFHSLSEGEIATAEVEVFGYGGAAGGQSREKREQQLTDWCVTHKQEAEANQNLYTESQLIYGEAVQAWTRCNELKSKDVRVETAITSDAKTVDLTLQYAGAAKSGILFYGVEAEGFTCTTTVPGAAGGVIPFDPLNPPEIKNQSIAVHCMRAPSGVRQRNGSDYDVTGRGVLSVRTASSPFQLFFAEEWVPSPPIGEVQRIDAQISQIVQRLNQLQDLVAAHNSSTQTAISTTQAAIPNAVTLTDCLDTGFLQGGINSWRQCPEDRVIKYFMYGAQPLEVQFKCCKPILVRQ